MSERSQASFMGTAELAQGREKLHGHLAMVLFAALISASFSLGSMAVPYIGSSALNAVRFLLAVLVKDHGGRIDVYPSGQHRHGLEPSSVLTASLETDVFEMLRNIGGRFVILRRPGHAAHPCIVSEETEMRFDVGAFDDLQSVLERACRRRRCGLDVVICRRCYRLLTAAY